MRGKKDDAVITTILGKDCLINGDFIVKQSARIDGEVQGNVHVAGTLIMGADAHIEGNIEAGEAILGGDVVGNVEAPGKVELTVTAKIIGDITTNVIVIDENAIFQGRCNMNQDAPRRKNPAAKKAIKEGRHSSRTALQEALRDAHEDNTGWQENGAGENSSNGSEI